MTAREPHHERDYVTDRARDRDSDSQARTIQACDLAQPLDATKCDESRAWQASIFISPSDTADATYSLASRDVEWAAAARWDGSPPSRVA